ncbi:MAG: hypothetical protein NWR72_10310 [Bacteroidia bacterium]|nr:hypothetical protein [Bacteroidia bacterium]
MDHNSISPDFSPSHYSDSNGSNGSHVDRTPLYEDTTLKALQKQVEQLNTIESVIAELGESCSNIRRALSALAPALEIHMHGLQSEASRWKASTQLAEAKYTKVFSGLEGKMDTLQNHLEQTEHRLKEQHQRELSQLKEEANELRRTLSKFRDSSASTYQNGSPLAPQAGEQDFFEL